MLRSITRFGKLRLAAAVGVLLAAGALGTAAVITDHEDVEVLIDGSSNTFDIVVAGKAGDPRWEPAAGEWAQGDTQPFQIRLDDGSEGVVLGPGGTVDLRVAAKNDSPRLASSMTLAILDPLPRGGQTDPETGRFVELFDQLVFTVRDGNTVIFDRVPASALTPHTWASALPAGDYLMLDVRIELPRSVDNEYQLASTDVQFHFEAEQA